MYALNPALTQICIFINTRQMSLPESDSNWLRFSLYLFICIKRTTQSYDAISRSQQFLQSAVNPTMHRTSMKRSVGHHDGSTWTTWNLLPQREIPNQWIPVEMMDFACENSLNNGKCDCSSNPKQIKSSYHNLHIIAMNTLDRKLLFEYFMARQCQWYDNIKNIYHLFILGKLTVSL